MRSSTTPILEARHLRKVYSSAGGEITAVGDVNFSVAPGELLAIVGPSGAGKSTVLRMLTGLLAATGGQVLYRGHPVEGTPLDFALVFQDYARSLFPWFNIEKNVQLPLVNKVRDATERQRITERVLAQVGLPGMGRKRPTELSGGQQQRVAIARALAYAPTVLIMDEPFASVDAQTRAELEDLVLTLRAQSGATVLLVTHDVDEAVYMADRVIVLSRAPSVVLDSVTIELPRERDQINTKSLPAFALARARILSLIQQSSRHPATDTLATPKP
ncbi:ABC transporter ATP-binding protein [Lampropedia puyangensis]|uniref:ABC transporter ATP-binding protein n=1 Tax=Lampropedia puyangensis TaxID=1330072 RepID=A0A4S8EVM5_9BURK|nr:ABC transporter ATP-binding protein [Lampropedia puyangensis]THT98812.1 ABC transporter ATP-binding protein [Lampropedia puyangensis]